MDLEADAVPIEPPRPPIGWDVVVQPGPIIWDSSQAKGVCLGLRSLSSACRQVGRSRSLIDSNHELLPCGIKTESSHNFDI